MKRIGYLFFVICILSCEKVVEIDLPTTESLFVVEGQVSDSLSNHPIRITKTTAFEGKAPIFPVENAQVIVQSRDGDIFTYSYSGSGYYESDVSFRGIAGIAYRTLILIDSIEIRSHWDRLPENVPIADIEISSFLENDPNNPNQQITIFYPKLTIEDPPGKRNFYRWKFMKDGAPFNEPDPIVIQEDRLFDGNLIPNNFRNFDYKPGEEMTVIFASISSSAFNYLKLLRAQITTLGTSAATTPAPVNGNLYFVDDESRTVLGFFGAASVSTATVRIQN